MLSVSKARLHVASSDSTWSGHQIIYFLKCRFALACRRTALQLREEAAASDNSCTSGEQLSRHQESLGHKIQQQVVSVLEAPLRPFSSCLGWSEFLSRWKPLKQLQVNVLQALQFCWWSRATWSLSSGSSYPHPISYGYFPTDSRSSDGRVEGFEQRYKCFLAFCTSKMMWGAQDKS